MTSGSNSGLDDIDALLHKAGLGDRIVRTRSRAPLAEPFTAEHQRLAHQSRVRAREIRAEWLLKLAAGQTTPADVIKAACSPELTRPLRKLRLDHLHRDHEHARTLTQIHERLARVYAQSGAKGTFCLDSHTRARPRTACGDFHPAQMTIAWLLHPSARGRRFRAWADLNAATWDGFPRRGPARGRL